MCSIIKFDNRFWLALIIVCGIVVVSACGTATTPQVRDSSLIETSSEDKEGIVSIESNPQGADIYVDSKNGTPIGKTPWAGKLEGKHTLYLAKEGYKLSIQQFEGKRNAFNYVHVSLSLLPPK